MKNEQQIDLQVSLKRVKSTKNNFQITLNLNDEFEPPSVHIRAVSPLSPICYQLRVTQEFIENHEFGSKFFDIPKEFMYHPTKTFQEAILSEEGELSMNILVGDLIRRDKSIKLQLQKKEFDKQSLLSLEIKILPEQFREQKAENQNIIVELKRQNAELKESPWRKSSPISCWKFPARVRVRLKDPTALVDSRQLPLNIYIFMKTFKKMEKIQILCSYCLDNPDKVGFSEYVVQQGVKIVHAGQGWDCYISRFPIKKSVAFCIKHIKLTQKTLYI